MKVRLFTDSCCDLPASLMQRYDIGMVNLTYLIYDREHIDDLWQSTDAANFYELMRAGAVPKTSQVNADQFVNTFRQAVNGGNAVLYLAFSSALSGTANAAILAAKMVTSEIPNASITVIDTKCASLGQGLLVYETAKRLAAGASLEELVTWVNDNIQHVNHWFTVGDLEYLKRGGRVSPLVGSIGSLLQIKPVLRVDEEGRLVPWAKARGRRKALDMLIELMERQCVEVTGLTAAISHADCLEEAKNMEQRMRERFDLDEVIIHDIGPVIGAHAGPDTLSIFFFGDNRS